jgi:hypothetical protein
VQHDARSKDKNYTDKVRKDYTSSMHSTGIVTIITIIFAKMKRHNSNTGWPVSNNTAIRILNISLLLFIQMGSFISW